MNDLEVRTNPKIELTFQKYPPLIREKILYLRELIIEVATKTDNVNHL